MFALQQLRHALTPCMAPRNNNDRMGRHSRNCTARLGLVNPCPPPRPVGISDLMGMTNAPLAQRTITMDGTLLKPNKPLTSVDSALAAAIGDRVLTKPPQQGQVKP